MFSRAREKLPFSALNFSRSNVLKLSALIIATASLLPFSSNVYGANQQIVIHWSTDLKTGSEVLMRQADGSPISSGNVYNGDGALVTLGYFNQATSDDPFLGSWIPLTSGTKFGDSSTGYGYPDGHFYVTSVFSRNSDIVEIYPSEPAYYEAFAPHPITTSLPSPGTPICIRFYDSNEITIDTKFNTVTGPDWEWPAFSSGIPENLYLKISNNPKPFNSRWNYGYTFQYPSNQSIASEPVDEELPLFNLNVNIVGNGTVSEHNSSYKAGSVVEISAFPADQYTEFARWEGNGLLQTAFPTTYASMTEDLNVSVYFQPKNYSVSIAIEGTGDVTISGQEDGYNHYGDVIDLNASPSLGFVFSHWSGFGPDANESLTTLNISQNHSLTAVFVPETYDLNVSVSSSTHGSAQIIQTGPYQYGGRYSLVAEAKSGYAFSHWSSSTNSEFMLDDANLSSTGMVLYQDSHFKANFVEIFNDLLVSMSVGGDSVSPMSGTFSAANLISVNAIPLTGYEFYRWNDPSNALSNPYLAQTDANLSVTSAVVMIEAIFRKKTFLVEIEEGNGGNVVMDYPNGPWEYLGNYGLRAHAQPGYVFKSWTGNDSSRNSLVNGTSDSNNSLMITNDVVLTANFEEIEYLINVTTSTGGEVSGSGTYTISDLPIIQAVPSIGWEFSHWEANETYLTQLTSDTSAINTVRLTDAPVNMQFTAHFKKITRSLDVHAIGGGKVNGQQNLVLEFPAETDVSIIATPADGWQFERWYDIETSYPYSPVLTLTPAEDLSFSALFLPKTYSLNLSPSANGSVYGSGNYEFGSEIQINASPNTGYIFDYWEGGEPYISHSGNKDAILTIPDQNLSITAHFVPMQISASVQTNGSGSVIGGGIYNYGETISLEANPENGNIFDKWEWDFNGSQIFSSENPLQLNLDRNFSIIAHFVTTPENYIEYELQSSPVNAGIVFDDPELRFWDPEYAVWERSLLAVANPGFSFQGWSSTSGLIFSPSNNRTQTITRPTTGSVVTANFEPVEYSLLITNETDHGIVIDNENNYTYLEQASFKAIPNEGKAFDRWIIKKEHNYSVRLGESSINNGLRKLYINEKESPSLSLIRGYTYEFHVQLEEDNPFFISTKEFNNDIFADEYLDGVSNSRVTEGVLTLTVPLDAPDKLFYHSGKYSNTGNALRILTKFDSEILPYPNSANVNLSMDHDVHLEPIYKDQNHRLHITSNDGGNVNFTEGEFPHGSTISLTATPEDHHLFVRWEGNEEINGNTNPFISITLKQSENIRAVFEPILYPLSVTTSPALSGIIETKSNKFAFPFGTEVEITVTPNSNYTFTNWVGKVSNPNSPSTTVIIDSSTEIIANLTQTPINVSVNPVTLSISDLPMENANMGGTILVPQNAKAGSQALFEANANEGFYFVGWYDDIGNLLSSAHSTYMTFSQDASISAIFKQRSVSVSINVQDPVSGVFSLGYLAENYDAITLPVALGDQIKVNALPFAGYNFASWEVVKGNEEWYSYDQTLNLEAASNLEVTLHFRMIVPQLSISIYPALSGIIPFGIGPKKFNEPHIINAEPLNGYVFDRWEGIGIVDPYNSRTVIDFEEDTHIKAFFKKTGPEYPITNSASIPSINNWFYTDWFGYYFWNNSMVNWFFHSNLGWCYFDATLPSTPKWVWVDSWNDWIWIDEEFSETEGTYVYSFNQSNWLLLDFTNRLMYNYRISTWSKFLQ